MKILQVIPDLNLAGAQTMCENLIMEQINGNNVVEVICLYNNDTPITTRLLSNGVKISFLNKKKGFDLSLINKIYNIICKFEPDIIHTHRYVLEYVIPAVKKCHNCNAKIIHTVHNVAKKEVPWYLQILQKRWFKKKKVIPVAISNTIKETIEKRYDMDNVAIVYNGINLNNCIKKKDYLFNNTIVHIGRFNKQKNHYGIISLFEKCYEKNNKLKLVLVGAGELKGEIETVVKEKKLDSNVIFKGNISDCFSILNESDIFILPSLWEGMPMTLIEAMGTGLPCVANPVGGIPDMIKDGVDGFLPNSDIEFIERIIDLVNDEDLRKKLGDNAINKSKEFSSSHMSEGYYKLYTM